MKVLFQTTGSGLQHFTKNSKSSDQSSGKIYPDVSFFFIFLFVFITQVLSGQSFNKATHILNEYSGNIISIGNRNYYLQFNKPLCCNNELDVVAASNSGSIYWKLPLAGAESATRLKLTRSGNLAVLSSYYTCDQYHLHNQGNYFQVLDTGGHLLHTVMNYDLGVSSTGNYDIVNDFCELLDSTFLLAGETFFYHIKGAKVLAKDSNKVGSIQSLVTLPNGNILVNRKAGTSFENLVISPTQSILASSFTDQLSAIYAVSPSCYLGISASAGKLIRYNAGGAALQSYSGFKVNDVKWRNDSLFCVGVDLQGSACYAILDSTLAQLHLHASAMKGSEPTGLSLSNSVFAVSTTSQALSSVGIHNFPLNGGFIAKKDVGVTNIVAQHLSGNGPVICNATVTVSNFGTDTVSSFFLNHTFTYLSSARTCRNDYHKLHVVKLAPGATTQVVTTPFYVSSIPGLANITFFTSVPDSTVDGNTTNDQFTLALIVGIAQNKLPDYDVRVYPNPFTNELNIESSSEITSVKLLNLVGQLIGNEPEPRDKAIYNLSDLPPGIYFVKIKTLSGTFTKKIIKN